jgi:hypothetical protein
MNAPQNNRVVNTILGIILVLFASLAAPKLPKQYTQKLQDPWLRFAILLLIAYLATKDLVTAIIAVVAVLITFQTFAVQEITDNVMNKTKDMLTNMNKDKIIQNLNELNKKVMSNLESKPKDEEDEEEIIVGPGSEPTVINIIQNKITDFVTAVRSQNPEIPDSEMVKALSTENPNVDPQLISECVARASTQNNLPTMAINDNLVSYTGTPMVVPRKQKQMLQGVIGDIYFDYAEYTAQPVDKPSNTLTESCSVSHTNNFNKCHSELIGSQPAQLSGEDDDAEVYGLI